MLFYKKTRVVATLCLLGGNTLLTNAGSKKPNVIYILADDLGYGDIGCFGQKTLTTPALDQMAKEGMRFTRNYSGSTVCAPSRCVLMTGLHTGHASVRGNGTANLKESDVTVAELFKEGGYVTGGFGKWGVGYPLPDNEPNRRGFDEFYGYVDTLHAHNFYPEFLVHNGSRVKLNNRTMDKFKKDKVKYARGAGVAIEKNDYAPDLIRKKMHQFLKKNHKKPFFLYYAPNTPHANNEGRKVGRGMEVSNFGPYGNEKWPNTEKGFAKMILDLDNDVKRIRESLVKFGIEKNTLIIFTSDNGPHSEGGHKVEYFDSNGEKRGYKRDMYEGGIRVPMIACWPKKIPAGKVNGTIVAFQDFMPTVAQLARVECPKTDGQSLLPVFFGKKFNDNSRTLYWEFLERGGRVTLLKGDMKLIKFPKEKYELYNVVKDPREKNNIINEHPELVSNMKKEMEMSHK